MPVWFDEDKKKSRLNLTFAGCGFMGIYHVGVCSALRQYAPYLYEGKKIAGASAGSIAACALICNCSLGDCTTYVLNLVMKARKRTLGPFHPSFSINNILRDGLDKMLPANAHILCSGRLHVSITKYRNFENELVSDFSSRDELIDALLCSAFIPFYSGLMLPDFRGERVLDGGFSNNLPELDEHAITVSPFGGAADICPNDNIPGALSLFLANMHMEISSGNLLRCLRVLLPPGPEVLTELCKQGFEDCLRFLQRNNLMHCTQHNPTLSINARLDSAQDTNLADEEEPIKFLNRPHFHPDDGGCRACKRRLTVALRESLPPQVIQVLKRASQKSLIRRIYETVPVRLVRLLIQPWTLPVDIFYLICKRFLAYLPSLPSDVQWLLSEAAAFVELFVKRFRFDRLRYKARLSCHVNIADDQGVNSAADFGLNIRVRLQRGDLQQNTLKEAHQLIVEEMESLTSEECADLCAISLEQDESSLVSGASSFQKLVHRCSKQDAIITWYYLDDDNEVHLTSIMPNVESSMKRRNSTCNSSFFEEDGDVESHDDFGKLVRLQQSRAESTASDSSLSLEESDTSDERVDEACLTQTKNTRNCASSWTAMFNEDTEMDQMVLDMLSGAATAQQVHQQ